jgi:hypothetical protein
MTISVDSFDATVAIVRHAATALSTDASAFTSLTDDELLAAQRELAAARRCLETCAAVAAAEIARRSRPELGYSGLAQRSGFRTPQKLVQHETGSTAREATGLVSAGEMVRDAHQSGDDGEPWMRPVGRALAAGEISIDAARAIRLGLGTPSEAVTGEQLAPAVIELLRLGVDADTLLSRARELRDDLDEAGIVERERAVHEQRAVRRVNRSNGLRRYIIDGDLESTAFLDSLYDVMTSPRRGGPRFVSPEEQAWAKGVEGDERTTAQYVHDGLLHLLRAATLIDDTDTRAIVGSRLPAVRLLAAVDSLEESGGHGRIEGIDIPVSIGTVERAACAGGTVQIDFLDGQPLNVGREQRLFTAAQRIALAARDGGCRWTGCDRPPSWTEAHHIRHWKRDHGRTDIADGVLLCRHHHMLLHNNGWEIVRSGAAYSLVPPRGVDPDRVPVPLPSGSAALRDLHHSRAG